jgi:ABC-type nitrate/sulfonate/bicarbonate transport system substrate-binding protein
MRKHWLIALVAMAASSSSIAQTLTKMVIGNGVDPTVANLYIPKTAGFFEKNGLDVQMNLGPSGSAMVPLLLGNQINAVIGAEVAGIQNHNLDPNIVAVAETITGSGIFGLVARNIDSMEGLKGKKIGVDLTSGSGLFWLSLVKKAPLNVNDYKVVSVQMPEMIAALERGDIDAYAGFEPWISKGLAAVPNTKILKGDVGILQVHDYIYMNRGWVEQNKATAIAFVRAVVEGTNFINEHRPEAVKQVAELLKLDPALTATIMEKAKFTMRLGNDSLVHMQEIEELLKQTGKLTKPVDWSTFFYPDLLKAVAPSAVTMTAPK